MSKKPLRTIQVNCPSWSDTPVTLREPRVRDYLSAMRTAGEQERSIELLKVMVLNDDGTPIGDAILDAPVVVLLQLSAHIPALIGQEDAGPLENRTGSSTASPSPSGE